jgi:hypothetical protein
MYNLLIVINSHVHETCVFTQSERYIHPIKNVYRDKNVLLLCHLSKVIKRLKLHATPVRFLNCF